MFKRVTKTETGIKIKTEAPQSLKKKAVSATEHYIRFQTMQILQ